MKKNYRVNVVRSEQATLNIIASSAEEAKEMAYNIVAHDCDGSCWEPCDEEYIVEQDDNSTLPTRPSLSIQFDSIHAAPCLSIRVGSNDVCLYPPICNNIKMPVAIGSFMSRFNAEINYRDDVSSDGHDEALKDLKTDELIDCYCQLISIVERC